MGSTEIMLTAAASAVSAVVGIAVGSWLTGRREVAADIRERRMALYTDAAVYAHYRRSDLDWLTGDVQYKTNVSRPSVGSLDLEQVTARMQLLAPKDVRDAWEDTLVAWSNLYSWLEDMRPRDEMGNPTAPSDQSDVVALGRAIERLQKAIRRAAVRGA